jgi:sacsin
VAHDSAFVVPWMKDYHRFTDDEKSLRMEEVNNVRVLEDYVLPNLPKLVDENSKASYLRFVSALASNLSSERTIGKKKKTQYSHIQLMEYRLAARQDGELCLASALYDHSDAVFAAAFRYAASSKFLIREARFQPPFWHGLGLRRREHGRFKGSDYLASLRALQCRLSGPADPHLVNDIPVILHPLCTNDGSLNDLGPFAWSNVAKLAVFPVILASANEPRYRRSRTEVLASQKNTLSLENIVGHEFAAVCWSQTPFTLHEPSSFSLQKSGLKSQPSCAMVWEHLVFLAECAQTIEEAEIQSFVSDLQRTYEFLHHNQNESKDTFSNSNAAIWLNAEATNPSLITLDVLQSSWTCLENLILDSPCDAPPLMMVHGFLRRFSSLLKEVGCTSMYYPSIALPSLNRSETALAAVRQLWEKDILNDVRFEAEGSVISAHKVILASRSLYCKNQFHGPWAVQSTKSKIVKLVDMRYAPLKILIEYCYNENVDWAAGMHVEEEDDLSVVADKLDALLDVLVAADRWLMPDLHLDAQLLRSTRQCQGCGEGGRRGECGGIEEVLPGISHPECRGCFFG